MDDKLARQLIRQLRLLNFWITLFGVLMLASLAFIGFMLWQVIIFAQDAQSRIEQTQERFNIEKQVCESEGNFSDFVRRSGACG